MKVVPFAWHATPTPPLVPLTLEYCAIRMSAVAGAQIYLHIFQRLADAKYVGSLGTVEWTKGSQLSQTSSSFIVVLYAVPFLKFFVLLIIPGVPVGIEPSRLPSSHRAIEPSRLDADGGWSHRFWASSHQGAIEAPSSLASSQHRAFAIEPSRPGLSIELGPEPPTLVSGARRSRA